MMQYHYGHMDRFGHHGGWALFGWVIPLLFIAALVVLFVLLFRNFGHQPMSTPPAPPFHPPAPPSGDAAIAQARLRYARGELSRDDYLQLVADLGGDVPPPTAPPSPPPPEPTP